MSKRWVYIFTLLITLISMGGNAFATGIAEPWQLGFQPAASPNAAELIAFHDFLMIVITAITLFVLALLVYVVKKFNRTANPTPSKTTHNIKLEVIWTAVPVLILVAITIPSLRVLYFLDHVEDADMTIKITGNQWYWSYEYPDHDDMYFDSFPLDESELEEGQPRLLAVDNPLVVPVGKNIRLHMTSQDVIHAWAVPALGIKMDTVPGRLNETWVRVDAPGTYYGQCSELCGVNHGYMPVTVVALDDESYAEWLVTAKEEFASRSSDEDELEQQEKVKVASLKGGAEDNRGAQ